MQRETSSSRSEFCIVSLGCPKNLVDSEHLAGLLERSGMRLVEGEESADIVVVNTCSFLEAARDEAMATIRRLGRSHSNGRKLVVAGCLVSHRGRDLLEDLPEVDAFIHPTAIPAAARAVDALLNGTLRDRYICRGGYSGGELPRRRLTRRHTAYVRIADGCDNRCSYCTVPSIRGPYRSRPIELIEDEVRRLAGEGVVEINLIAQDTTSYGRDLYGEGRLPALLGALCAAEGRPWIRLLYAHPAHFEEELIDLFREEPSLCPYIDLPVQHISDRILSSMGRGAASSEIRRLLDALREKIPGLALRTTVIVGYPGETDEEFGELMEFISGARFERLGAFSYSREEGTPAFGLQGQVDEEVKAERLHAVMSLQASISREINESLLGRAVEVLVDACLEGEYSGVGRTRRHAPDVDGAVFLRGRAVEPGDVVTATIVAAGDYDLIGEVRCEYS